MLGLVSLFACSNSVMNFKSKIVESSIDTSGQIISTRFPTPRSFKRTPHKEKSYGHFLRNQALFPANHVVKYYNGERKRNAVYDAVLKIDVGKRDLQQCADAVMRLRAEFLFKHKKYRQISFRFLGDGKMHSYLSYAKNDRSYAKFRKYMDYVFSYANTASLKKQLKRTYINEAKIGDILIQSGNPYGHAITIMDQCKDSSGNQLVLLAQSYMPAQEIHILKNPNNENISPWYNLNEAKIKTPEWTFDSSDLRKF